MYRLTEHLKLSVLLWLITFCLSINAAEHTGRKLLTLRFTDEPLPSALKRLEKAGGKSILFTYKETERFKVTAAIVNKTQAEALAIILSDKPFAFIERDAYFVVQYSEARQRSVKTRKAHRWLTPTWLCWPRATSRTLRDALQLPTARLRCRRCRRAAACSRCLTWATRRPWWTVAVKTT